MSQIAEGKTNRMIGLLVTLIAWSAIVYHMTATQIILVSSMEHQIIHLAIVLVVIYLDLARRSDTNLGRILWLSFALISSLSTGYIFYYYLYLEMNVGFPASIDVLIGLLLIVVVIVGTWRCWGLVFPALTIVCLLYFFMGHLLPQPFYHPKFSFEMVVGYLSIFLTGIFGPFLAFMANFGFLLVFFGALLEAMGANRFFMEVGKLGGRVTYAGPAHTAVIGSSFVGMASGSAIGNVIITGSFTIPTMKKSGYPPETAAAVEAAASTGSQIMPPIMGSAVFLMAGFLGKPYDQIMIAGIVPALLYYFGLGVGVELWARKRKIKSSRLDVDYKVLYSRALSFVVPLGVLTTLLVFHYSAGMASFWAILLVTFFGFIQKSTRPSLIQFSNAITKGVLGAVKISIVIATVAMIAQSFIATGLGNKVAYFVQDISGNNLYIMLFMTMIFSIILGCGMPTMAAYALMAILVAPSLVAVGLDMFQAHFFCFYFAIMAAVTPPVALASLAAAGIAESNYYKTGFRAFLFSISGFIFPYFIVFNPSIMLMFEPGFNPWLSISSAFLSVLSISAGGVGFLLMPASLVQRFLLFASGVAFGAFIIIGVMAAFVIGLTILAFVVVSQSLILKVSSKESLKNESKKPVF